MKLKFTRYTNGATPKTISTFLTEELLPNNGLGGTNGFSIRVADTNHPWLLEPSGTPIGDPFATGITVAGVSNSVPTTGNGSGLSNPGLLSHTAFSTPMFTTALAGTTVANGDEPLLVAIQLVFRRRMGMSKSGYTDSNNLSTAGVAQTSKYTYCYVRMTTEVQVRSSGNY